MRLTWVQPEDLVGHALAQAGEDGVDVADLRARWIEAGGDPAPAVTGASGRAASPALRALAGDVLDEIDARPSRYDETEPTDLDAITDLTGAAPRRAAGPPALDRVHGAWLGRAAGCLLGKPVEKIPRRGIREILEATGRWPLADWFTARGLPDDVAARWPWNRRSATTSLAENIDGMPEDDDLNFPMLNLALLEEYGAEFTTEDVAQRWLAELPAGRVFTAERVAYRNLLLGRLPPLTARVRNPFRDWIGAQIRGDVFGWVRPGDPAGAAALAWRDAVLSHTRNGVYGEMFVAAMCSAALVSSSADDVLDAGLSVVPTASRYADAVRFGRAAAAGEGDWESVVDKIEDAYGHLHWVHVLNNTALVAAALVHGGGDFERTVTAVVAGGWDTDSNGATAGSVAGALTGAADLPARWIEPLRNRVTTTLSGFDRVGFDELARRTIDVAEALA
ncbi:ADP-ribosylglycohydrolase family protein [Jiangella asiatica]|uniref:ADP-ribosylglycohydrolase family protein n=1 Tax=Jiangella asiatica TaxID=2530372 RepID=A0A4R5CJJ7_9ACTN|nr:ADP-ribosylglycohydrolase family protein [Jiangella asiatica]TDE00402.1 ADP-ribosylglycohydrolase family protein [Jiangella asiatica]